jgi:signal transduction histidine kinase
MTLRLWPRSLLGQMLLSVALALLVAQGLSAALLWRAEEQRRETSILNAIAFRVIGGDDAGQGRERMGDRGRDMDDRDRPGMRRIRLERTAVLPIRPGEARQTAREKALSAILTEQGMTPSELIVVERPLAEDSFLMERAKRWHRLDHHEQLAQRKFLLAALRAAPGKDWIVARVALPQGAPHGLHSLIVQTMLLYIILVGLLALLLRRITRPLALLTKRVERFARTREAAGQLQPHGPEDISRLIDAHNAMEGRIAALLDEKDVMLGAIGHDLKTPLAGLRIRIESVSNETERAKMAATVEDITRTLDDILSLARVGRPSDPLQKTELSALVASVVEEYEDMGEPAELGETERVVLPIRETWLRRALRNLIGNALRYGGNARVSLRREGRDAVIHIADDGPGIPPEAIAGLFEPFARGEPSRNRTTGGAGLGLTLARAIAEQHGGRLTLVNRPEGGLLAELRLPLS